MLKGLFKLSVGSALVGSAYLKFVADDQTKVNFYGIAHSIANSGRAGYALSSCIWDYYYSLRDYEYNSEEYHKKRSEIHSRSAKKILWLSEVNRGVYLKAGQYLGNLEKVMPHEFTDVLKVLQDSGPHIPFEEARIVVDYDLGKLEDIYETFEKIPIAAASLAQVHKAKLKNGPEVAVKLQFPFLKVQTTWDLQVLKWNQYENIDLVKNFNVFSGALINELDFRHEVENAEKTREDFADDPRIVIPKNYLNLSSQRVITQEFMYGAKINDVEGIKALKLDTVECAKLLVDTFSKMIFVNGHVHCDAHPGNLLIRNDPKDPAKPQLIILDHGFYRILPDDFRYKFSKLWKSLVSFDYDTTREVCDQLGIGKFYKYLPIILLFRTMGSKKKIGEKMTVEEREEIRKADLVNFEKINQLMSALPPNMLFIIRATNLVAIHNGLLGEFISKSNQTLVGEIEVLSQGVYF